MDIYNNGVPNSSKANSDLSPKAPEGWNLISSEPRGDEGEGYRADYQYETEGKTAELSITSNSDENSAEIVLYDYDTTNKSTITRRFERTVPITEEEKTLNELATEWVAKTEEGEWPEENGGMNPRVSPDAPEGWELFTSESTGRAGEGYRADYRSETNGMTAELGVHTKLNEQSVQIILVDYNSKDKSDLNSRYKDTVPRAEAEETLNEIATEWVRKTEADEWHVDESDME